MAGATTTGPAPDQRRRGARLAIASLLFALAAPFLFFLLIDVRLLHQTGLALYAACGLAVVLSVLAISRDRRAWVRMVAGGGLVLGTALAVAFAVLPNLPRPAAVPTDQAPDFTLLNHRGEPVSLAELRAGGPVALVFYRGHW